jgi:hypothetical protein
MPIPFWGKSLMKTYLPKNEIKEGIDTIQEVFLYIVDLRKKKPAAKYIQFPKISCSLSESIILHLIKEGTILPKVSNNMKQIKFGGNTADIIAKLTDDTLIKIEVKATGKSAFQTFGVKDIKADYLIWIHFDEYFLKLDKEIVDIFIIKNPNNYFSKPDKITLDQVKSKVGNNIEKVEISLIDFLSM